jgi:hypothetical protein
MAAGEPVLVPFDTRGGSYLSGWDRSGLEPLFMVSELKRAGAIAILVAHGSSQSCSTMLPDRFTYRLDPSRIWLGPQPDWDNARSGRSTEKGNNQAVVLNGIRGHEWVLSQIDQALIVQGGWSPIEGHETLYRNATEVPTVELNFTRHSNSGLLRGALQQFCCDLPFVSYRDWLLHISS